MAAQLSLRHSISKVVQFGNLTFKKCEALVQNGAMGSPIKGIHHDPQLIKRTTD
jgi:hypothetical protein